MSLYQELRTYFRKIVPTLKTASVGLVFIGIVVYLNPENPGYVHVTPHPYLIAAILFGAVLGIRSAFLFNLALMSLYLYFLHVTADMEKVETVFSMRNLLVPMAIVFVPILVGFILDRKKIEIDSLNKNLDEKESAIQELQIYNAALNEEKESAERRLAYERQTLSRVFEFSEKMETENETELGEALIDLVRDLIYQESVYIYLFQDGVLKLCSFYDPIGKLLPDSFSEKELNTYPLIEQAMRTTEIAQFDHIVEAQDEFHQFGVVTPLKTIERELVGLLVVRKLSLASGQATLFSNLNLLSNWAGVRFDKIRKLKESRNLTQKDEWTGLNSYTFFSERLIYCINRAKKYFHPIHTIRFQFENYQALSSIKRETIRKIFAEVVRKQKTLEADSAALGRGPDEFLLLLTYGREKEVHQVYQSIRNNFLSQVGVLAGRDFGVKVFCSTFEGSETSPSAFFEKERLMT